MRIAGSEARGAEMEFNMTVSAEAEGETPSHPFPSCILYQNDNVTLIDIPRSIAAAQGAAASPCHRTLRSCAPLCSPFADNKPKSDVAMARLKSKMATPYDQVYAEHISHALATIRANYPRDWCLPRSVVARPNCAVKKRKLTEMQDFAQEGRETPQQMRPVDHETTVSTNVKEGADLSALLQRLVNTDMAHGEQFSLRWRGVEEDSNKSNAVQPQPEIRSSDAVRCWTQHQYNVAEHYRELLISSPNLHPTRFHIPPGAAFYLGDCASSRPFHLAVQSQARAEQTMAKFDVVIMDPPWPNSSVSRARKSGISGYETALTMWDIRQLIFETDINVILADRGLVAIWITNKPAVRELVLGEDGLFDSWDLSLVEEWLWIKTTRSGDPVSSLDSLWRKPYEVLLLGRRGTSPDVNVGQEVKRRVIAAVPDLHSRKPCLKELIEPLMPNPASYRALEVFARYLVAGWWAWGNEVLKFNHESCWSPVELRQPAVYG